MNSLQGTIDGQPVSIGMGGEGYGVVRFGSDDKMNVHFYVRPILDPIKSREVGRPWKVPRDYVRIQHPGEKDTIDRPVTEDDKRRWPRHWEMFQKGHAQIPDGTPVDVLFPQSPEIPENLHTLGCHTVEQLANMTEHGAQTIGMGATQWRNKAREFLSAANGGAGMHKLQKQLDDEKNKNEVLANQMAQLQTQVSQLLAMQQGVPRAMIPVHPPTVAQQASQVFSNDGPEFEELQADPLEGDQSFDQTGLSTEPLFLDPNANPVESSSASTEAAPKRRGRPPGSRNHVN